jgi:hypothetical protein
MSAGVRRWRGVLVAAVLAAAFSSLSAAQSPAPAPKKNPLLKLIEPWPSAEVLAQRRVSSETLPLFNSPEPFEFTLSSDFKALNKDRNPESRKRYPGELRVTGAAGAQVTIPVQLSARGHVRRMARTCDYVPIRIEFPKKVVGERSSRGRRR